MQVNVDKSNMREVIINFPNQFKNIFRVENNLKKGGDIENIIVCGVGGSTLPADILLCLSNKENYKLPPAYIHRDYGLPKEAGKKSLIICISFSGNTEETLSALEEAVKKNFRIFAIASGGKLEEICRAKNIPFIKVPGGIQPRSAMGYLFSALAKILEKSGLNKNIAQELPKLAADLEKNNNSEMEEKAKELAKKLINKIPLIYASGDFKCLARIWKIKFNENSKIPAFYNYFPELNHNEMVGFTNILENTKFYILTIRDENDNSRNLKRMSLFAEIVKTKGIETEFVDIKNGSTLFKIFSTLLFGDWVSYYLALEYKIDPTPVKIVEEFKKELEK